MAPETHTDQGIHLTNVNLDDSRAYKLFIAEPKYTTTGLGLAEHLEKEHGKSVETIHILPNAPPPGFEGSFIVLNPEITGNCESVVFPLDQAQLNHYASQSPFIHGLIEQILMSQDILYISAFKNTPELTLQSHPQIRVIGPDSGLYDLFDDKIYQRLIASQIEVPIPNGKVIVGGIDSLIESYKRDFGGPAFVSLPNGHGGSGSQIVHSLKDILGSPKIHGDKFILTELLDVESSPCSLALIANPEEVQVVSIADQLMDGVAYQGNIYPSAATPEQHHKIEEYTRRLGKFMAEQGYRGFMGVDFVIDSKGEVYFIEINPRKIGSTPEIVHAYSTSSGHILPQMEFDAVTKETLNGWEPSYPKLTWGVKNVKASTGQITIGDFQGMPSEEEIFHHEGAAILDHPGHGRRYLAPGRVARIVSARRSPNARVEVLRELKAYKEKVRLEDDTILYHAQ